LPEESLTNRVSVTGPAAAFTVPLATGAMRLTASLREGGIPHPSDAGTHPHQARGYDWPPSRGCVGSRAPREPLCFAYGPGAGPRLSCSVADRISRILALS
jgi:hypothetical protein